MKADSLLKSPLTPRLHSPPYLLPLPLLGCQGNSFPPSYLPAQVEQKEEEWREEQKEERRGGGGDRTRREEQEGEEQEGKENMRAG